MQNRLLSSILTMAAALAFSPRILAQTPAQPDLSGTWLPPRDGHHRRFSPEDAPLQPWAMEIYKINRQGVTDPYEQGLDPLDPMMYCLPPGVPRAYTAPAAFSLFQVPGQVLMIFESASQVRYIYTDGRDHPDGFPVTFMGHSIGKYDGDTLVVDTIGVDESTWLDTIGTPHSDALHVVERLRRVSRDTLEVDFRFEDPKAYTRPWTGKKVFKSNPDWQIMLGSFCEDRFKADFEKRSLRDKKDWIEFRK